MDFFEIFPTVIAKTNLSKEFDFEWLESYLRNIPVENHFLLRGGKSSHNRKFSLLESNELASIKSKLQSLVDDYCDGIGIARAKIDTSWHSTMSKNSYLFTHRHEGSVVTGALYVNAEEGSSPLTFETPLSGLRMCEENVKETEYSPRAIHALCETGTLYLFPSWLRHGSVLENYNENRIVISFNTVPLRA